MRSHGITRMQTHSQMCVCVRVRVQLVTGSPKTHVKPKCKRGIKSSGGQFNEDKTFEVKLQIFRTVPVLQAAHSFSSFKIRSLF